ncbi:hypothetical protein SEUCBS139899_008346 [Sporothrix eucalyptigena]|uniref:Uncharacterized protein n=1 Tax=Sporothrix eucalyptigena TaxID=1812306 RepID=A0ABP0ATX0_9PEZI
MTDYSPSPVVNSGSTEAIKQSKPVEPAGIPGLPTKPVFGGDNIANKSESPDGGVLNGTVDKKDDTDFAKPVTPVSEANGHIGGSDNADSDKPGAIPLPLTEEPEKPVAAPTEAPKPTEPASSSASIPTATAPSVTLAAPTTAPATNGESSSLTAGLPAKAVESVEPPKPAEDSSLSATNAVAGEKRKVEGSADAPAADKDEKPAGPALTALFGTGAASSFPAKPPAPEPEADTESPAKKLKTDTVTDTDTALPSAPAGTPAAPPAEVPAPAPVTVSAPEPAPEPVAEAPPPAAIPSVDPAPGAALEANLGPAPSADEIANTSAEAPEPKAGVKKSNSRAKREKKPLPPVGKTARKTRSQGPV